MTEGEAAAVTQGAGSADTRSSERTDSTPGQASTCK